jgi:hypothetical protein
VGKHENERTREWVHWHSTLVWYTAHDQFDPISIVDEGLTRLPHLCCNSPIRFIAYTIRRLARSHSLFDKLTPQPPFSSLFVSIVGARSSVSFLHTCPVAVLLFRFYPLPSGHTVSTAVLIFLPSSLPSSPCRISILDGSAASFLPRRWVLIAIQGKVLRTAQADFGHIAMIAMTTKHCLTCGPQWLPRTSFRQVAQPTNEVQLLLRPIESLQSRNFSR